MASSNQVERSPLHDWVVMETRALDVVASWETLCDVYRILEFQDPIGDQVRMEEFKWIIHEMNKHLTRARKQLLSCRDLSSIKTVLEDMFKPGGSQTIIGRRELAYQKLRQRWVVRMLSQLEMLSEQERNEEEKNVESDFWNE